VTLKHSLQRLSLFASALLLATGLLSAAATDRPKSSTIPKVEIRQLVDLLERYHYNRQKVRPATYSEVIRAFMEDLDQQRLFFLSSDLSAFEKKYSSSLYYNLRELGSVDCAYEMFEVYEQHAQSRITWIFEELKKDISLDSNEFYRIDRSKSDWPESVAAADDLWRKRLKYELASEILAKKTMEKAKETVRKRYERWQKSIGEMENLEVGELFLSSFARLYDPHSTYFSADTYEDFGIQMKLQLVGIGAVLGIEEDTCVIKEIMPGGPADLDKRLKPNDKILAVSQDKGESVDIVGMKLRKIVELIRGQKGTQVHLLIQPSDDTDGSHRREIVLTRDVVKLNSARAHGAIFDVPAPDGQSTVPIGVISLPSFYGGEDPGSGEEPTSASKDVAELVTRLKAQNVVGIVLDLRRNGGGLLGEAIELTGLFINNGPVVQVKDYTGHIDVDADENNGILYDGPLAVLVDRFSASASEIVAGALQNYGRAVVIGDTSTHGKGSVQTVIEMKRVIPGIMMPAGKTGAAKLTVQKFYLPSGASTQLKGVIPDIVLPSIDDYLPIGESDLNNALVWDEIPSSYFDGKPLNAGLRQALLEASKKRQADLPEFAYVRKDVDRFKLRYEQKLVSVNLEERRKQKEADDAFRKEMKLERQQLEKNAYAFKEVRLVPAPPPRIKAEKKPDDPDETPEDADEDTNESYSKTDIRLREALRVVEDAIELPKNHATWKHDYAPLTARGTMENALGN
jgi:carboxyl-terminal processing protease